MGIIADSTDMKGIPFATVTIMKLPEKSIKKQLVIQADGKFETILDSTGEYVLTVNLLGYKTTLKNFSIKEDQFFYDLGIIPISTYSIELNSVEINASLPLVKLESDKLIYNVESDIEAKTSDGLEIMKKVPMLVLNSDDKIQVNGNKNVIIFINGKPSKIVTKNPGDFLQNTPAYLIKSIEVISKPGAKYDAEGTGAIINIVMKKKPIGYNCALNSGISFFNGQMIRNGISFTTAFGKIGATINIQNRYLWNQTYDNNTYKENYIDDNHKYTDWSGKVNRDWFLLIPNIDISYDIDTLNLISVSLNSEYNKAKYRYNAIVEIENIDNIVQNSYLYGNPNVNLDKDYNGNINYQNIAKNNKRRILTLSYQFDYVPFELKNEINIDSIKDYKSSKQILQQNEYWTEHTFQIDYTIPLNHKAELETGAKYILRKDKSSSQIFDYSYAANQFIENTGINNNFSYKQSILAAYLTYGLNINKLSFKLGIRAENSNVNCTFISADTSSNNSVTEFVPNTNINYKLSESQNLGFSYTKKIQRPSAWHINPYIDKSDPNNYYSGNPNIKDEHFNNFELNYGNFGKFGNFNCSIAYMSSNDAIEQVINQINAETILTTWENIAKVQNYIASVSLMLKIGKKIRFQINPTVNYNDLENTKNNTSAKGWGCEISSDIEFRIKKGLKFTVSGSYFQTPNSLQSKFSAIYNTNFTLKKEFLKSKLIISLLYNNAFWKYKTINYELFDATFYQITKEIRQGYSYGFKISYNFGKLENDIKKVEHLISNDDLKAKGK